MYFTNSPALRSCEAIMTKVPGFGSNGGGSYRNLQRYKKEDCDCRRCPNYSSEERCCSEEECPILGIRIHCGAAFFYEAVKAVFKTAKQPDLCQRLDQYIKTIKDGGFMIYRGKVHKRIFEAEKAKWDEKGIILSKRFLAAVYLLSTDNFLWSRIKHNIKPNQIDFRGISLAGVSPDGYVIWKAARELYPKGSKHPSEKQLSFSELADQHLVPNDTFSLIIQAITIGRYGFAATKLQGGK